MNANDADPIDLLRELVAIGRGGEGAVQKAVAARLAAAGAAVEALRYDPASVPLREEFAEDASRDPGERTAIVARLAGSGGGRSLILFAHPDCEPITGLDRWSKNPFAGDIVDGRLHGWGVADDLSGVAAMLCGLELALADGWRPRGDIIVASTPSKRHARGVAAVLDRIAPPDAALYLHPAESGLGMAEIKACTPGLLEFTITLTGEPPDTAEPGHAAFAHRARNPIDALQSVLAALRELDAARDERVRHARLEAAVGRATSLLVSRVAVGAPGGSRNRAPVVGLIEGSVSFPPGENIDGAMAELRAAVAGAALPEGWPLQLMPRIAFPAGVAGAETPADHPLFVVVAAAVRQETGREPFVNPVHTASDIRVPIVQKGVPTLGLGPLSGDLAMNGRVDEWVDAEDHRRCMRVVARAIRSWCG